MLTAVNRPKWFSYGLTVKCRSDESFGNERVKRGKPRELETQNW